MERARGGPGTRRQLFCSEPTKNGHRCTIGGRRVPPTQPPWKADTTGDRQRTFACFCCQQDVQLLAGHRLCTWAPNGHSASRGQLRVGNRARLPPTRAHPLSQQDPSTRDPAAALYVSIDPTASRHKQDSKPMRSTSCRTHHRRALLLHKLVCGDVIVIRQPLPHDAAACTGRCEGVGDCWFGASALCGHDPGGLRCGRGAGGSHSARHARRAG